MYKYHKEIKGPKPIILQDPDEVNSYLIAKSRYISGDSKKYMSGTFEGCFIRDDTGEVFEQYLEFGAWIRLAVWKSKADREAYSEGAPRNIYFEF